MWYGCYGLCQGHKATELAHSFLFCSCVYFCFYGPFNCISFHKFSQQLSVFSLCSSGLISALLVLSTIYLFMKVSFSPDIILCHQLTNSYLTLCCYRPLSCILSHKFSRQLSAFSLCSSRLISVLLVLSTIHLFMKVYFNPDVIPSGWLDSEH